MLVLICLAIVHRLRPTWLAITITEAVASEHVSLQRVSRLCTAAIAPFDAIVTQLTRRGRPPCDEAVVRDEHELAILRALLDVATGVLRHVSKRKPAIRELLVCAWTRLQVEHPKLTKERFCAAIGVPPRTFRDWPKQVPAKAAAHSEPIAPPKPPRPPRPLRRPRFTFDVNLPDTQLAADTTDITAFGIGLKIMAAQDVGGRDRDLLDAVIVNDHESAEQIVELFTQAIAARPGMQVITDQGTPYMAAATRAALDDLGAEHAPQREADPIGKSTIERAFGLLKPIAGPLLDLTNRLADVVPSLRSTELAKAVTTLVLVALLRAYQTGARAARRADEQRAGIDPGTLARLAEESRNNAVATEHSARLLLTHLHSIYGIERSVPRFIRDLRRYPLEVLRAAEQEFGRQAHRADIRDRATYFAAIVRRLDQELRDQCARRRSEKRQRQEWMQTPYWTDKLAKWRAEPMRWIYDVMSDVADSPRCRLPTSLLFAAIDHLTNYHGPDVAADLVRARLDDLVRDRGATLKPTNLRELAELLDSRLPPTLDKTHGCEVTFLRAILQKTGPQQRPAPP